MGVQEITSNEAFDAVLAASPKVCVGGGESCVGLHMHLCRSLCFAYLSLPYA